MTPEAVRELWVRFVSGEALPAAEQAALVAALDADPELRAELLEDVQLDGALRALGDARRSGAAFAAAVGACLEPERDATRFVRKVEARLADLPPEPAGAGRDSRSNLPRISRRFHRRGTEGGAGWRSAVSAAAAFLAIVLLATAFSKSGPKPKTPSQVAEARSEWAYGPDSPPMTELQRDEVWDDMERHLTRQVHIPERPSKPAPSPEPPPVPSPPVPSPGPVPEPEPAPLSPPPPKPEAQPATPPTRAVAAVALDRPVILRAKNAYAGKRSSQSRAEAGKSLEPNQDIWTYDGYAEIRYADGTTVTVLANSIVSDISDAQGRRILLGIGGLESKIERQPEGRPMIFETSHSKAVVLGTEIKLTTDKARTALQVKSGKVKLVPASGEAPVEVSAGFSATTADLTPRVLFPREFYVNFGPADTKLPADGRHFNDSGLPFHARRGYGWVGTLDGKPLANWINQAGKEEPKVAGRQAVLRGDPARVGSLKATDVVAGWGAHAETWRMPLPNGVYQVTVCVGDPTWEQGPHRIEIEGALWIADVLTKPANSTIGGFREETRTISLTDGELTMRAGGTPAPASADGSTDTILNYLFIRRVR